MCEGSVMNEGITDVDAIDIQFAKRFGYVFKPLSIAEAGEDGSLVLRVHPALVPEASMMAHVTDALNTVQIVSASLGPCMLTGAGAIAWRLSIALPVWVLVGLLAAAPLSWVDAPTQTSKVAAAHVSRCSRSGSVRWRPGWLRDG